jgi:glycosyltransferase involved in cell wall biosynthesis
VRAGDPEDLARALAALAADPMRRERVARAGRARAAAERTPAAVARAWLAALARAGGERA